MAFIKGLSGLVVTATLFAMPSTLEGSVEKSQHTLLENQTRCSPREREYTDPYGNTLLGFPASISDLCDEKGYKITLQTTPQSRLVCVFKENSSYTPFNWERDPSEVFSIYNDGSIQEPDLLSERNSIKNCREARSLAEHFHPEYGS